MINKSNLLHLFMTVIFVAGGLGATFLLTQMWSTSNKARLELAEKELFHQAINTCLQAGTVSWVNDNVTTQTPHQESYANCLQKKATKLA